MTGNQEPKFVDITDEAMENSSDVSPKALTNCMNVEVLPYFHHAGAWHQTHGWPTKAIS